MNHLATKLTTLMFAALVLTGCVAAGQNNSIGGRSAIHTDTLHQDNVALQKRTDNPSEIEDIELTAEANKTITIKVSD